MPGEARFHFRRSLAGLFERNFPFVVNSMHSDMNVDW
jgi:hypothetical protein